MCRLGFRRRVGMSRPHHDAFVAGPFFDDQFSRLVSFFRPFEERLTKLSCPNISCPLVVNSTGVTLISQPLSLLPTSLPSALPSIWWPKQTPISLTFLCSKTSLQKFTSLTIQGSLSKLLCLDPVMSTASISLRLGYSCAVTTSYVVMCKSEGESGGDSFEAAAWRSAMKTPP